MVMIVYDNQDDYEGPWWHLPLLVGTALLITVIADLFMGLYWGLWWL
jgi:hypothetical protein